VQPVGIAAILLLFIVYSTIRIFMAKWYYVEDYHYLTPLYSPCMTDSCVPGSSHFGTPFGEFPFFLPLGIVAFPIVAGFRVTCYYYRKAGYRSLWASPPACSVTEPHQKYTGETRFPLFVMNWHRYFFYLAFVILLINIYDAFLAFRGPDGAFGIGLGTLIILVNIDALLPRLPARDGRAAEALLPEPGALPLLDVDLEAERPARHVRHGVAVHGDLHRLLHHGRICRLVHRPAVHQLEGPT